MPWLSEQHGRSLQESINHVTRFVEDLDSVRERAQVVKDELANSLAEKLNKNLYVLAVISAVFLPLGFLTGLLGINVGGMPGADDRSAFWLVCAMLMMIVVAQVVLFRRFRLF
jgi:zinc transporter